MNFVTHKYDCTIEDLTNPATPGSVFSETLADLSLGANLGFGNPVLFFYPTGSGSLLFDNLLNTAEIVPEPSTIMLFGIGAGLLWRRRRGQQSAR